MQSELSGTQELCTFIKGSSSINSFSTIPSVALQRSFLIGDHDSNHDFDEEQHHRRITHFETKLQVVAPICNFPTINLPRENANDNTLVRVQVTIDISSSIELLLGSLDPVLAEVLRLVVASNLCCIRPVSTHILKSISGAFEDVQHTRNACSRSGSPGSGVVLQQ